MKKLLVVGAGFLQDFIICKAHKMGYEVFAVDANSNAEGFQHADKHAVIDIVNEKLCLEYAKENEIDGVLTAATEFGVLTASFIAEHMGLPGLNYKTAQLLKNKCLVRKCLCDNHVDDSELSYEVNANTDINSLASQLGYPVIVKPCDGSGSRGVCRVDSPSKIGDACNIAMSCSLSGKVMIEPFVVGKEYGAECLVVNDIIHILGIMRKWMTDPPYYAELGHALPNDLAPEVEEKVNRCVFNAIRALKINSGAVNMDIRITPDNKVFIVDIGGRMGGNMIGPCIIPYGTGIDYLAAIIKNALGESVELEEKHNGVVATRLLAFNEGVVQNLLDMKQVEKDFDVEIYHHLSLGMKVSEYHTNRDGCGYIVARADSLNKAIAKAEMALEYIKGTIFGRKNDV